MKKLKGQLLRWILIVRKLQNQPYISFRELQRELERELAFRGYDPICSDATLKRDLNELKEEFGLDITYSRTHKGYSLPTVRKGWLDMDCIIEPIEVMTALGNHSLPEYILPEQYQTGVRSIFPIFFMPFDSARKCIFSIASMQIIPAVNVRSRHTLSRSGEADGMY